MAWIRTTFTLLADGIALDKGLSLIRESRIHKGSALFDNIHIIGIVLPITATIMMILFTLFYVQRSRSLANAKRVDTARFSTIFFASFVTILLCVGVCLLQLIT